MDQTSAHGGFSLMGRMRREGPARLLSDLINPLFLPPFVFIISGILLGLPSYYISGMVLFSLTFYSFLPLGATFYLLKKKKISSLDLPERRSRNQLFLFSIGCALAAFLGFSSTAYYTHPLLGMIALVYLINPIIGFLINLIWKMSIHTTALASTGAVFFSYSLFDVAAASPTTKILSLLLLLLLLPLMICARYRLKIHSHAELFGGALAGFSLTIIEFYLFSNLW